jgi:hypothetical protein
MQYQVKAKSGDGSWVTVGRASRLSTAAGVPYLGVWLDPFVVLDQQRTPFLALFDHASPIALNSDDALTGADAAEVAQ